jgi:hypothetical protein
MRAATSSEVAPTVACSSTSGVFDHLMKTLRLSSWSKKMRTVCNQLI